MSRLLDSSDREWVAAACGLAGQMSMVGMLPET